MNSRFDSSETAEPATVVSRPTRRSGSSWLTSDWSWAESTPWSASQAVVDAMRSSARAAYSGTSADRRPTEITRM